METDAQPGLGRRLSCFHWITFSQTPLSWRHQYGHLAVSLVSCWQWLGIPTMMFVAALRNISTELLEAARLEGAGNVKTFWYIKLPLIKPVVGIIAVLTFVNNFNAFDIVFAMENVNGAPEYSTDLIGTLFYRYGIAGQHPIGIPDAGLGAAIATITFLLLMVLVLPTLKKNTEGCLV